MAIKLVFTSVLIVSNTTNGSDVTVVFAILLLFFLLAIVVLVDAIRMVSGFVISFVVWNSVSIHNFSIHTLHILQCYKRIRL